MLGGFMLKPLDKHTTIDDLDRFETKWEETISTAYDYWLTRPYCPACDSKRTKPCICRLAKQPKKETLK